MNARSDPAAVGLLQAEDGERIGVLPLDDRRDFVAGSACQLRHRRPSLTPVLTGTSQISSAYWRIVRSEENQPMCAVLRIALAYQSALVLPERVDLALRGGIGVEIGARP